MTMTKDASAMTEASGLAGDEERIDRAVGTIQGVTKEMVEELLARRARLFKILRQLTVEAPLHSLAISPRETGR
jgi:hypothetical protein